MTKKQFEKKLGELIGMLGSNIRIKAGCYIEAGAIDIKEYGDDYELPRIVLSAALDDIAWKFSPLYGRCKEEAENLRHF